MILHFFVSISCKPSCQKGNELISTLFLNQSSYIAIFSKLLATSFPVEQYPRVLDVFWTSYVRSGYVLCLRVKLFMLWARIIPC